MGSAGAAFARGARVIVEYSGLEARYASRFASSVCVELFLPGHLRRRICKAAHPRRSTDKHGCVPTASTPRSKPRPQWRRPPQQRADQRWLLMTVEGVGAPGLGDHPRHLDNEKCDFRLQVGRQPSPTTDTAHA